MYSGDFPQILGTVEELIVSVHVIKIIVYMWEQILHFPGYNFCALQIVNSA